MSRIFRLLSTLMPWIAWRVTTKYGDRFYPRGQDIDWPELIRQGEPAAPVAAVSKQDSSS